MLFYINLFFAIAFPSLYSAIWRRIVGVDLDISVLCEIALIYIVVAIVVGFLIHFTLITSLIAFGFGVWGILKTVTVALKKGVRNG